MLKIRLYDLFLYQDQFRIHFKNLSWQLLMRLKTSEGRNFLTLYLFKYWYHQFFTLKEFAITKALLNIIAIAENIGFSFPITARPIPIMLYIKAQNIFV